MAQTTGATIARQPSFEELGTALIDTTFVVLDLETTGLSPDRDRITEMAAVKVTGGEVRGELATLVHPGRPIPAAVSAITGITDAMVRGAPTISAVLPALLEFLGASVLVAHNARFDLSFLRAALREHHGPVLEPVVVDTARLARRLVAEEVRDVRLSTLATHLRARTRPEHRALADARATVDVLHGLIERAGAFGATTLEDLCDLARSTSHQAFKRVDLVRDAPRRTGTYRFLGPDGEVLYVGKATDLRARLRTYFGQDPRRRIADLVRATERVTWVPTATLLEAEVLELRAIRAHRPRFNRRSKHPERQVHVALTREPFPRLSIVRTPRAGHGVSIGPIASRRVAQQFVEAAQQATGLRACTSRLRRAQDHSRCVLLELGRCGGPCDGSQTGDQYAEVVRAVEAACSDPGALLEALGEQMAGQARRGRYEQAAELRSRRHTVARVVAERRRDTAYAAGARVVAARIRGEGLEVAVVSYGRLAGTVRLPAGSCEVEILRAVARLDLAGFTDDGGDDHAEERRLVRAWLETHDVRLVHLEGHLCEPVAGGRVLATTLKEATRVERQVRRDRQVMTGAKVARRPDTVDQQSSNQGLKASGARAREPASRPSQLTRIR